MVVTRTVFTLMLVVATGLLLSASTSSAATIFESDMSDFGADFFTNGNLGIAQNANDVMLTGLADYNAAESFLLWAVPIVGVQHVITLDVAGLDGVGSLRVLYYEDAAGLNPLGPGENDIIFPNFAVGLNIEEIGVNPFEIPLAANFYRLQLRIGPDVAILDLLGGDVATLDHLSINSRPIPEPGTAALFAFGLVGLVTFHGRRRR